MEAHNRKENDLNRMDFFLGSVESRSSRQSFDPAKADRCAKTSEPILEGYFQNKITTPQGCVA